MNNYYVGIDMGTSSAKLVLIDGDGILLSTAHQEYSIDTPKIGWKEIDPEKWFLAVKQALHQLLEGFNVGSVACIGITGQMHTTSFLDKTGEIVRPSIMWNDTRATKETEIIKEWLSSQSDIMYLKKVVANGCAASSLKWLAINEPESFGRISKFLIGPDYLVYRFSGNYCTNYCESSTSGMYDLNDMCWSDKMLSYLGVNKSICPLVKGCAEKAGTVSEELTEEFGFSRSTAVIAGTGDNPAASIATGSLIGNYPTISIGTSGVIVFPQKTVNLDSPFKNVLFSLDGKEIRAINQGTVQSGGNCLSWLVHDIFETESYADVDSIDTDTDYQENLLFYPHFVGEKAVRVDPHTRGAFLGLSTDTTRQALALSVIEGVCFALREIFEHACYPLKDIDSIKVTGGGGKNPVWLRILSSVLNKKIEQLDTGLGAAYGIALIAADAADCKGLSDFSSFLPETVASFEPVDNMVDRYNRKYKKYCRLYTAIKSVYTEE